MYDSLNGSVYLQDWLTIAVIFSITAMTMIEWKLNLELRMMSSGITAFNA